MSHGKRSHPTESIGVSEISSNLPKQRKQPKTMSEINTVHAFGAQGQETSGWPNTGYGRIGTLIPGTSAIYKRPRLSQNELGGGSSRPTRRRKHSTSSIGV